MTFTEIKEKLAAHGIYQLNKGETVGDALRYVDCKLSQRIGYKIKANNGRLLSRNEVIAESNKEAFAKSVTIPEYEPFDKETTLFEDGEDFREDTSKPGILEPCMYCGKALRIDEDMTWDILNCNDCMGVAILKNCM